MEGDKARQISTAIPLKQMGITAIIMTKEEFIELLSCRQSSASSL